jgi:2-oxoglutarate ferredoxin oxidoreductase subunit gamma
MNEKVIMAGFGGQGVMLIGQLLTYAGMYEDKEVSWLPSYGPEMRGGTANCHVCVSDKMISSPIITKATSVIIMNNPSLEKFLPILMPDGDLFINSSLVDSSVDRRDVNVYFVPANEIANELGTDKAANMVMLGAYLKKHPVVGIDTIEQVLKKTMKGRKEKFIPVNIQAIEKGMTLVD